ncbi:hypothetical protein O181_040931 [Austropuccinia psidii MF-1]|uniref:Uncharacterized protein n=1 Tax=Austropuccinia psidii MF-1 TaxID=1389203 RepID=A0A9Q3DIS5_9BASI|nr:hypothetical protein [Austropuccinia psidii MF-1]
MNTRRLRYYGRVPAVSAAAMRRFGATQWLHPTPRPINGWPSHFTLETWRGLCNELLVNIVKLLCHHNKEPVIGILCYMSKEKIINKLEQKIRR